MKRIAIVSIALFVCFHTFAQQASTARQISAALGVDIEWFVRFFGTDPSEEALAAGVLNGIVRPFVDPLIEGYADLFSESGAKIFAAKEEVMRASGIDSPQAMLSEALAEAVFIKYAKDHGATQQELDTATEEAVRNGFDWMAALVSELDRYDLARDQYYYFDDFMPRLAEDYLAWAGKID